MVSALPLWISLLTGAPAAAQQDARYEARYVIAGFLVRSVEVCGGDQQRTLDTAHKFVGSSEYRGVAQAAPERAAKWLDEGINIFDADATDQGTEAACSHAALARRRTETLLVSGQ